MQIRMDKENRELKAHGSYEFPVNISYEQLSRYERGSFSWHWHPEIELTFVLSGQIGYQVNGKSYVLKEGDGIFCNTNALHSGHMIDGMDCVYISTTFAPRFLYGFSNSVIQTRYVEPVLTDMQLASIVFSPEIDWQNRMWIYRLKRFYGMNGTELASHLIPITCHMKKDELRKMTETDGMEVFSGIEEESGQRALEKAYTELCKKYPMSLAPVFKYLYDKEQEIDHLTSILEGIRYQLLPGDIRKMVFAM